MKEIQLNKKNYPPVLVDDEDYKKANQFNWRVINNRYVTATHKGTLYLHRLVMNAPKGLEVDHINGNTFDNRKENLRLCPHALNRANSKRQKNNTSGYKGVNWSKEKRKWRARLPLHRSEIFLGYFSDPQEAAKAYNDAAIKHWGEFARLNDI